MPVTASGPITTPLHKLAQLVAETQAFQERASLVYPDADAFSKLYETANTKRIHYPACNRELSELAHLTDRFPVAVLTPGESWDASTLAGGSQNYLWPTGQLTLILADKDKYPNSIEDSGRDFCNFAGDLLQDLYDLAAKNDRLAITEIHQRLPPSLPSEAEDISLAERRYWVAAYAIHWQ